MSTRILGISAFYHDSAAALVVDGKITAAAQEERFTRQKHDHRFPQSAVDYCLAEGGLSASDLDYVAFYDKPLMKFERLLETYIAFAPASFSSFINGLPLWLKQKLHLPAEMDQALRGKYRGRYVFADHHQSHAASAFFPSPFEEAAILTLDGVGEWSTTTLGFGRRSQLTLTHELRFPHSLGLLYSAFTHYTGFRVNSGEYKVMGLSPYGEPRYRDLITRHLIDIKEDGSFWMDMSYFNYCPGLTMTNEKFHDLFGGPPRRPESPVTQRDMDLAASIQVVCEDVMLRCSRHLHKLTGMKNLVMAGGVALNCVGNGRILRQGPFQNIWIQPAAGDAGAALGAALLVWHQLLSASRELNGTDSQKGSLLGPAFGESEIREFLNSIGAAYHVIRSEDALLDSVTELLRDGKVVGWFHGRMEFGPRALGSRSIIGDARDQRMQEVMNLKIKFRESFRPFAPSVLAEFAPEYFDLAKGVESPYMLLVASVTPQQRETGSEETMKGCHGMELLYMKRSSIPAVTHVDYSARVQTVDPERHGRYYRLLKRFYEKTGCPVIINTSFNVRGEPIVCSPADAHRCFMGTHMDALVLENMLLIKKEQPGVGEVDQEAYREKFARD